MDIQLEKLIQGGDALGRLPDGTVVFVEGGAPGDRIRMTLPGAVSAPGGKKGKKPVRLRRGGFTLVEAAQERAEPPCSVFGICGGCQWQHLSIESQRRWKREIVAENLRRLGKLPDTPVLDIPNGEAAWHYRNKAQWFADISSGRLELGYYAGESHRVVPFDKCWIIPDGFNPIAMWLRGNLPAEAGLDSVIIRQGSRGDVYLRFLGEAGYGEGLQRVIPRLAEAFPEIRGVQFVAGSGPVETLLGTGHLAEEITLKDGSRTEFRVSLESFFQVNRGVAHEMVQAVADLLPEEPVGRFADIYAGVGTFALALRHRFKQGILVESAPSAVADARENLELNQAQHLEIFEGSAEGILGYLQETVDIGLVDPPRQGCEAGVLDWLAEKVEKTIFYVSCDSATLARDLRVLVEKGWRVRQVQPFDMFPQTYHVESLAVLDRL